MDVNQQLLELIKNDDAEALEKFNHQLQRYERIDFEWLYPQLIKVENGNSLRLIGEMYYYGHYMTQDYQKAYEYYLKSAGKGNYMALNDIGYMYRYGFYVKKDDEKAYEYYLKSAEKGNHIALNNLGNMYYIGDYVKQNFQKALEYWFQATLNGLEDNFPPRPVNNELLIAFWKSKYTEQTDKITELEKENEKLKMELECIPEYGEAYREAKLRFESNQQT